MTVTTEPESPHTRDAATPRMKALVYHGPGKRAWDDMPRPAIDMGQGRCKLWLRAEIEAWSKHR